MFLSRLTITRGGILYDYALLHNCEIIGPHIATHVSTNCDHRPGVLDTAVIRTSAVPIYIESVEALSSCHNPVILVMDLEPYGTLLPEMEPFTVNCA
jgi:hypothetical protein